MSADLQQPNLQDRKGITNGVLLGQQMLKRCSGLLKKTS